jgi:hypothetical protein
LDHQDISLAPIAPLGAPLAILPSAAHNGRFAGVCLAAANAGAPIAKLLDASHE